MKSIKYVVFSCAVLSLLVAGCTTTKGGQSHGGSTIETRIGDLSFTHDFEVDPKSRTIFS